MKLNNLLDDEKTKLIKHLRGQIKDIIHQRNIENLSHKQDVNFWQKRALKAEENCLYGLDFKKRYKEMGLLIHHKTNDFNLGIQRLENEMKKIWIFLARK